MCVQMSPERLLHTVYLARPMKHKITQKYDGEEIDRRQHMYRIFQKTKRPVTPIHNRRLDMLTTVNKFRITPKWQEEKEPSTSVPRAVLEHNCTPRIDHLSKPSVRYLQAQKKDHIYWGKAFVDMINEKIQMSLDTIYYHNIKSLMNIRAIKRSKMSKSALKKHKIWDEDGDPERMEFLATPKKAYPPAPLRRRKRKKLHELIARIDKLAHPIRFYKRPSQESFVFRLKIKEATLNYQASDRINELTIQPEWRLEKPWVPVGVKRSALLAKPTERTLELAIPRPRAHAIESDLKENPYDINPWALKCKPSQRICELAKPIER